ncbi:MAG: DUF4350 domain-containing protein [Cytophagaceae bacterium]
MSKLRANWYWLLVIPVIFVGVYLFSSDDEKQHNWNEHYRNDSKDPFGTFAIQELLKTYNKDESFELLNGPLHKQLPINEEGPANYVFIGDVIHLSQQDIDNLLAFVASGNTAFIAGNNFSSELMNTIFGEVCEEWSRHHEEADTMALLNLLHEDLYDSDGYLFVTPPQKIFLGRYYSWRGINSDFFCDFMDDMYSHLGYIGSDTANFVNFIESNHGNGKFIFHTTPIVFTNYHLLTPHGKVYASKVFSHLNTGKIFWDQHSKVSQSGSEISGSPLKLILSNRSLRTAWYLSLFFLLTYILFFAKRRQRTIPIHEQLSNSSLNFIKSVGNLYLKQKQPRRLMKLKMQYFLSFIRQRYHLSTNNTNKDLIIKLSGKSGIEKAEIENIFQIFNTISRYDLEMTDDDLIKLHTALDYFYKNCK